MKGYTASAYLSCKSRKIREVCYYFKMEKVNIFEEKQPTQDLGKDTPTALELLIDGLNESYHFISYERQLYVYDEEF